MPARPTSSAVGPAADLARASASVRMLPAGPGANEVAASSSTRANAVRWKTATRPITAITAGISVKSDE